MPMGEAIQAAVSQLERIRPDAIFGDDTHYSQLVWSGSTRICSMYIKLPRWAVASVWSN